MHVFQPIAYSISDFYEWYNNNKLELNPNFQRRSVWTPQIKSNLINTIILGLPMPNFFVRTKVDPSTKKSIREVVDGQQRLRTIFDYIDNGFTIKRSQNNMYGGLFYSELPEEIQSSVLSYRIPVIELEDMQDREILDIFARINSYGVKLNKQELLNAKYFGAYKSFIYELGYEHTSFWNHNNIISTTQMLRMKEAEFVSELVATILGGIQDSKSIEKYYSLYDEAFDEAAIIRQRFNSIIDMIGNVFEGNLKQSKFAALPLFYSLFVVLYHMNYGIPSFDVKRTMISEKMYSKIRNALEEVESIFNAETLNSDQQKFITSCKKSTTDKLSKQTRCKYIAAVINSYIGE